MKIILKIFFFLIYISNIYCLNIDKKNIVNGKLEIIYSINQSNLPSSIKDTLSVYKDSELKSIKELVIINNKNIDKLEGLDKLINLEKLTINASNIKVISGLSKNKKIKELYLFNNQIEKIEGLDDLGENLIILNLESNKIKKIEGLDKLKKLNYLIIRHNQIKKIENLDNLNELEGIFLSDNNIEIIENILNQKKMLFLDLMDNPLKLINKETYNFLKNRIYWGDGPDAALGKWFSTVLMVKTNNINLYYGKIPSVNSNIISVLNKNQKLELLYRPYYDEEKITINGVKGNWVKVKTDKGEVGWCFDGYLEEVK